MLLPLILTASLLCAVIVVFRYYRVHRLAAGIGWALIIFAIGGFGSGLAESFDWAGFLFLFIGAAGLIIVFQEEWFRRKSRRRKQKSRYSEVNH
jgi:hypothetical protein